MNTLTKDLIAILCLLAMLLCVPVTLIAAEYKDAEDTAPKSVDDIDNMLENIAGTILLARTPVIDAIDEWRRKRGPFWRDGNVKFNFRTMDFEGEIGNFFETQAWAAPGEIAYRSGQWRDFLTLGASVYGSYELSESEFPGATGMLQLNGDNITTLGQAYFEFGWKGLTGRFYRQSLDFPYLNRNDSRMIPNTFEAYGFAREGTDLDFYLGYVDKIKLRNREDFIAMSEAAGVKGRGSGTSAAGILWSPPDANFSWGASVQQTSDVFRLIYTEVDWKRSINGWGARISAQYSHQESIGEELIGTLDTGAFGLKASGSYRDVVMSLAYTETDDNAKIKSPFGGRPGYTSSMLRDFDRAGEEAWRVGLSYHFDALGLPGWSGNINYTSGRNAVNDDFPIQLSDNREIDYTLDFKPDNGRWAGLWLRIRYANVREDGSGEVANQLRLIVNYSLTVL